MPMIAHVVLVYDSDEHGPVYSFKKRPNMHGHTAFIPLFVPEGLVGNEILQVKWFYQGRCACADLMVLRV